MDTVRLGLWFASFKDEVFDGKSLKNASARKSIKKWFVCGRR